MQLKLIFMLGWAIGATSLGAAETPSRLDLKSSAVLDRTWKKIEHPGHGLESRALSEFALEATLLHWHPERVAAALSLAETMQDRTEGDKAYGNFRWYYWQDRPIDLNAGEFFTQRAVLLRLMPEARLDPAADAILERLMRLSVTGLTHHPVQIGYTNIFLMKTWNLIALGEVLHASATSDLGYTMLESWMKYTAQTGVTEYMSTTYTGVQLDCLALIARYAPRQTARTQAVQALRLLYLQSAANWFAPDQRLGGAHSRDYDYLTGHGQSDRQFADWGWIPGYKPSPLTGFLKAAAWVPETPLSIAPAPRQVWQRWGPRGNQWMANSVGRHFSLGVAGCCAGPEDKFFTINLTGGPTAPMANLFVDGRGDLYGQNKEELKDGHTKAHHLTPFVASAQTGSSVLLYVGYDPAHPVRSSEPLALLNTHFDLPAAAEFWDRTGTVKDDPNGTTLELGESYFLRQGDVVIALRCLASTSASGEMLRPVYYTDGAKWKLSRISWAQAKEAPQGESHVLLYAEAHDGISGESAFAALRAEFVARKANWKIGEGRVTASVEQASSGPLALDSVLDPRAAEAKAPPGPLLVVNGEEVGLPLVGGYR